MASQCFENVFNAGSKEKSYLTPILPLCLAVLNPRHLPGVPSFVCLFFTLFEARIG